MKCTMCDFRRKANNREKISLMDIKGCILSDKDVEASQQLEFMFGEMSLEKRLCPVAYKAVVTVSGADPNGDLTVCTIASFPTKVCPNCGKVLK
jgi:hypothetical protein